MLDMGIVLRGVCGGGGGGRSTCLLLHRLWCNRSGGHSDTWNLTKTALLILQAKGGDVVVEGNIRVEGTPVIFVSTVRA